MANTSKSNFFAQAAKIALTSSIRQQHAAVIVHNHKIIAIACNDLSYHAEEHALRLLQRKLFKQYKLQEFSQA